MSQKIRVDIEKVEESSRREGEKALEGAPAADQEAPAPYRANGAKHGGVIAPR